MKVAVRGEDLIEKEEALGVGAEPAGRKSRLSSSFYVSSVRTSLATISPKRRRLVTNEYQYNQLIA